MGMQIFRILIEVMTAQGQGNAAKLCTLNGSILRAKYSLRERLENRSQPRGPSGGAQSSPGRILLLPKSLQIPPPGTAREIPPAHLRGKPHRPNPASNALLVYIPTPTKPDCRGLHPHHVFHAGPAPSTPSLRLPAEAKDGRRRSAHE